MLRSRQARPRCLEHFPITQRPLIPRSARLADRKPVGVLAALSIVAFLSGLPVVLAFAAVARALLADDVSSRWMPRTALVLAALTVVGATVLAFTG